MAEIPPSHAEQMREQAFRRGLSQFVFDKCEHEVAPHRESLVCRRCAMIYFMAEFSKADAGLQAALKEARANGTMTLVPTDELAKMHAALKEKDAEIQGVKDMLTLHYLKAGERAEAHAAALADRLTLLTPYLQHSKDCYLGSWVVEARPPEAEPDPGYEGQCTCGLTEILVAKDGA